MPFGTLTSVVKLLLMGNAGSLPRGASTLSGLREDFLQGVGKMTRCTSQRDGTFSISKADVHAFTCEKGACRRIGEHAHACQSFFQSHWNESKMQDVKLFVPGPERTSLLSLISANKTFEMIFRFSYSCGLQDISKNTIRLKSEKYLRFFETFNARGTHPSFTRSCGYFWAPGSYKKTAKWGPPIIW